jgi:NAD(P)-dependent dehydrogenase (short-subunit alcohol dehydrogenase family)
VTKKVAVITGGTSGIGLAVAAALSARGVAVVLAGRDQQRGRDAVKAIARAGSDALFVSTDVSREADVRALFEGLREQADPIEFIFNNAGVEGAGVAPPAHWSEEECDRTLAINVKGAFFVLKHGISAMLATGGGAVVSTASFVGTLVPVLDAAIYGATKAALISMTRAFAAGYADRNVRCYAVCPWVTDTPLIDRLTNNAGEEGKAGLASAFNPSGKIVATHEVADVVCRMFLESHAYASGDVILVDSGGGVQKMTAFAAGSR